MADSPDRGRSPDPDRHHIHVEVVALSLTADGALGFRHGVDHLRDGETPDEAATRIGLGSAAARRGIVHSTSWRHTAEAVVLTYVVAPDPTPGADRATLSADADLTRSSDPERPGAALVTIEAVVAHASRHLALLADTDPLVAEVRASDPALWAAIRARGLALAGQLPASLHPVG